MLLHPAQDQALQIVGLWDPDKDGVIDGHWANLFSGIAPAPDDWTQ